MYFHQLRTHHAMGLVQTISKGCWQKFGCFRVFFVSFRTALPVFFGEGHVFGFEIIKFFDMQNFIFEDQLRLGIV